MAGHQGDRSTAEALLGDPDPTVVATALGALARIGALSSRYLVAVMVSSTPELRRRVAELLPQLVADDGVESTSTSPAIEADLEGHREKFVLALLADEDDTVVDAAAWAAGELWEAGEADGDSHATCPDKVLEVLMGLVTDHGDSLVRESAVAALGSIGSDVALPMILLACGDKASVRRRAVLALAPFDGPEVAAALERASADRDWQVRQAAEDLLA